MTVILSLDLLKPTSLGYVISDASAASMRLCMRVFIALFNVKNKANVTIETFDDDDSSLMITVITTKGPVKRSLDSFVDSNDAFGDEYNEETAEIDVAVNTMYQFFNDGEVNFVYERDPDSDKADEAKDKRAISAIKFYERKVTKFCEDWQGTTTNELAFFNAFDRYVKRCGPEDADGHTSEDYYLLMAYFLYRSENLKVTSIISKILRYHYGHTKTWVTKVMDKFDLYRYRRDFNTCIVHIINILDKLLNNGTIWHWKSQEAYHVLTLMVDILKDQYFETIIKPLVLSYDKIVVVRETVEVETKEPAAKRAKLS